MKGRTVPAVLLALALFASGDAEARGWRHRTTHAHAYGHAHGHARGARCALGLFYRPSTGSCSRAPYGATRSFRHAPRRGRFHAFRAFHVPVRVARAYAAPAHRPAPVAAAAVPSPFSFSPPTGLGWVGGFKRPRVFQ